MENKKGVYWPAVLSFICPGLGQIAKLEILKGYLFLLFYAISFALFYEKLSSYLVNMALSPENASIFGVCLTGVIMITIHISSVVDSITEIRLA